MIIAIIRPERLDFVKKKLEEQGIHGMTVMVVEGRGEQNGITLQYRGGAIQVDLLPKLQVEIVVRDSYTESVIRAICEGGKTGKIGDGRIFIIPIERSIKVRTGEEEKDS